MKSRHSRCSAGTVGVRFCYLIAAILGISGCGAARTASADPAAAVGSPTTTVQLADGHITAFVDALRNARWRTLADISPIRNYADLAPYTRDGVAIAQLGHSEVTSVVDDSMPTPGPGTNNTSPEPAKIRYLVFEAKMEQDPCTGTDSIQKVQMAIDAGFPWNAGETEVGDGELRKYPLFTDPDYMNGVFVVFPVLHCGETATTGLDFAAFAPGLDSTATIGSKLFGKDAGGESLRDHYKKLVAARTTYTDSGGTFVGSTQGSR